MAGPFAVPWRLADIVGRNISKKIPPYCRFASVRQHGRTFRRDVTTCRYFLNIFWAVIFNKKVPPNWLFTKYTVLQQNSSAYRNGLPMWWAEIFHRLSAAVLTFCRTYRNATKPFIVPWRLTDIMGCNIRQKYDAVFCHMYGRAAETLPVPWRLADIMSSSFPDFFFAVLPFTVFTAMQQNPVTTYWHYGPILSTKFVTVLPYIR